MKLYSLASIFLFALIVFSPCAEAQVHYRVLNDIVDCFMESDADRLSNYFGTRVEITLSGKRNAYAPNQAKFVLRDFFETNPIDAFSYDHQGNAENTLYALGTYRSASGIFFEVDLYLKRERDTYVIDRLRFERR